MRTLILTAFCLYTISTKAQVGVITETFTVKGNCEQCKDRIENAADLKGVKVLTWSPKTKIATVSYSSDKISLNQIEEAIAAKGHDAGPIHGNDKAYSKLPKCCKYRDAKCEESKN
ncbi:MAG: heavy-metal-associated domain-containing protein [bacterium]|nr:heavy-metal-associated domain-containing protein [bacterium]